MRLLSRVSPQGGGHIVHARWGGGGMACAVTLILTVLLGYSYLYVRSSSKEFAGSLGPPEQLCELERPAPLVGNLPYLGRGPHSIAVFHQRDQSRTHPMTPVAFDRNWVGTPFAPVEPRQVELVACAWRVFEERTGKMCTYEGGPTPLYRAVYRVQVLAAASARRVAEMLLWPGSVSCPPGGAVLSNPPKVFTVPTNEDYDRTLGRLGREPARPLPGRP